jgi:hypothetical protein
MEINDGLGIRGKPATTELKSSDEETGSLEIR